MVPKITTIRFVKEYNYSLLCLCCFKLLLSRDGKLSLLTTSAFFTYFNNNRTLVGSGLKPKSDFSRPLASLIPPHISLIPEYVQSFLPDSSSVKTSSGRDISYDTLVVATGLQTNFGDINGLRAALEDPNSGVSTIYSYDTCDKVWADIEGLKSGKAIFTQPAGIIKCAGGMSTLKLVETSNLPLI